MYEIHLFKARGQKQGDFLYIFTVFIRCVNYPLIYISFEEISWSAQIFLIVFNYFSIASKLLKDKYLGFFGILHNKWVAMKTRTQDSVTNIVFIYYFLPSNFI